MRAQLLLWVVMIAAGCTDLPPIVAGACCNGVVEAGAVCDGIAGGAAGEDLACGPAGDPGTGCRYVCAPLVAGAACPDGWACGADGVCRRASGSFAEAPGSPLAIPSEDVAVLDFDGDGVKDVIGHAPGFIAIRYGSGAGAFGDDLAMTIEQATAAPDFADLDGDARADVVVPSASGLSVLLGQEDRTLAPVPFSSLNIGGALAGDVHLLPLDVDMRIGDLHLPVTLMLVMMTYGPNTMMFFLQFEGDPPEEYVTVVTDPLGALAGRIPVADVNPTLFQRRPEFAMPFVGASSIQIFETVNDLALDRYRLRLMAEVSLPGPIEHGARFADVNGDGHQDLLASVVVAGESRVAVAHGDGAGSFGLATVDWRFDTITTDEGSPWPLAAADLTGDGAADYVGNTSVYMSTGLGFFALATRRTAKPWVEAAIGDFNNDSLPDVAAVSEAVGVELLMGMPSGFFTPDWRDTEAPPHMLRLGDFDGDQLTDVATVERSYLVGGAATDVSVLFGNMQGGPAPPVSMGSLQHVAIMETADLVVDWSQVDDIDDLIVMSAPTAEGGALTGALLMGSAGRRLLSPFMLIAAVDEDARLPQGVRVGRFLPGDERPDLLALTWNELADGGTADHLMWLIEGQADALFSTAGVTIGVPDVFATGAFDPACAVWAVGDLDGDGTTDEVVGIDGATRCPGAGPPRLIEADFTDGENPVPYRLHDVPAPPGAPEEAQLADVDGDGALDLLVRYRAFEAATVVVYWNAGGQLDVAGASPVPAPPGTPVTAACALNADGDPALEVALAADGGIWLSDPQPSRTFAAPTLAVPQAGTPIRLLAADVDGDGLADLVASKRDQVSLWLSLGTGSGVSSL